MFLHDIIDLNSKLRRMLNGRHLTQIYFCGISEINEIYCGKLS
jgi:hypothetical protein